MSRLVRLRPRTLLADLLGVDADVIIVGGGPAGLSAALVLGRCLRRVLLFDHGRYRNARARKLHGYLTRDGIDPRELRQIARKELARYTNVSIREHEVTRASASAEGFVVEDASGERFACRKLLLATGLRDRTPPITGIEALIGVCAFHCPYCDGWELRDQPLIAYGEGKRGATLALELLVWSKDVVLCTGGRGVDAALRARLDHFGIALCEPPIERVTGSTEHVCVELRGGATLTRRALFYSEGCEPPTALAAQLGVSFDRKGSIETGRLETTNVPGVYVAGDASRDALQAIVAAGEGSKAAVAINQALFKEDILRE